MQIYEVSGKNVIFGMGLELQLSDHQAEIRSSSIKRKKGDVYEVLEPIQFKQGELVIIVTKTLSKAVLANLKEISTKESSSKKSQINKIQENKTNENTEYPCIQHVSFGKYNVLGKAGNLLTEKPIKKDEAEKILSEISAKNQESVDENQADLSEDLSKVGNDVNALPTS
jgi:hypothetical protein